MRRENLIWRYHRYPEASYSEAVRISFFIRILYPFLRRIRKN